MLKDDLLEKDVTCIKINKVINNGVVSYVHSQQILFSHSGYLEFDLSNLYNLNTHTKSNPRNRYLY